MREKPDLVLVAGDVNSTVACALVAQKLHVESAHLQSTEQVTSRRQDDDTGPATAVLTFPLLAVRQVRLRAKKLRSALSAPVSPPWARSGNLSGALGGVA